jgi:hypothetical protein
MRTLLAALATFTALAVPSTASAAIVHIDGGASGHGFATVWHADFNTVSKDVTIDATYTLIDGSPTASQPQRELVILTQPNGVQRAFNFGPTASTATFDDNSTAVIQPLVAVSDGQPGILNKGPQTYNLPTGLRVSANRAGLIDFETDFLP